LWGLHLALSSHVHRNSREPTRCPLLPASLCNSLRPWTRTGWQAGQQHPRWHQRLHSLPFSQTSRIDNQTHWAQCNELQLSLVQITESNNIQNPAVVSHGCFSRARKRLETTFTRQVLLSNRRTHAAALSFLQNSMQDLEAAKAQ
jgi:hypothetical protein